MVLNGALSAPDAKLASQNMSYTLTELSPSSEPEDADISVLPLMAGQSSPRLVVGTAVVDIRVRVAVMEEVDGVGEVVEYARNEVVLEAMSEGLFSSQVHSEQKNRVQNSYVLDNSPYLSARMQTTYLSVSDDFLLAIEPPTPPPTAAAMINTKATTIKSKKVFLFIPHIRESLTGSS